MPDKSDPTPNLARCLKNLVGLPRKWQLRSRRRASGGLPRLLPPKRHSRRGR
jgi:hypothetical protein